MTTTDPRRRAQALVGGLREGTARAALRAFVRGRDEEGRRLLARAGFAGIDAWLDDAVFYEALLDALEHRIAPADDDEDADSVDTAPYDLLPGGWSPGPG